MTDFEAYLHEMVDFMGHNSSTKTTCNAADFTLIYALLEHKSAVISTIVV